MPESHDRTTALCFDRIGECCLANTIWTFEDDDASACHAGTRTFQAMFRAASGCMALKIHDNVCGLW